VPVEGMTCGSCVARIERTVKKVAGVQSVRVSLRDETMTVRRGHALVSNAALAQAVEAAGYRADSDRAEPSTVDVSRGILARIARVLMARPPFEHFPGIADGSDRRVESGLSQRALAVAFAPVSILAVTDSSLLVERVLARAGAVRVGAHIELATPALASVLLVKQIGSSARH
jgi:copper chaperone CopZ